MLLLLYSEKVCKYAVPEVHLPRNGDKYTLLVDYCNVRGASIRRRTKERSIIAWIVFCLRNVDAGT